MRIRFDDFVLDTRTRQLACKTGPVRLSPKAFELLQILAERRPRALSKRELIDSLWPNAAVQEENLKARVAELRRALGDNRQRRYIRTVSRFGYAFDAPAVEDAVIISGWLVELEDRQIELAEGENVVGRDFNARIRIASSSVSRRHARIIVSSARAVLEDLGSKNGTLIGAERVTQPTVVQDGDCVQFGSVLVRIRNSMSLPSTGTV